MIYFLSGLPRSGSTLIGSILNQNPDIYVSPTSPMLDLLCAQNEAIVAASQQYTFDVELHARALYDAIPVAFYKHIKQPYIIDKHRAWARNVVPAKSHVSPDPKIICTNRPVAEVVTSFIKLINRDPDNVIDQILRNKRIPINTNTRAMELWEGYIRDPWDSLQIGLKSYKENLYFVQYDDLIADPQTTIDGIYNFLEIPKYTHVFDGISNTCSEAKDAAWGFKDLHTIRPKLEKTSDSAMEILGPNLCNYFAKFDI